MKKIISLMVLTIISTLSLGNAKMIDMGKYSAEYEGLLINQNAIHKIEKQGDVCTVFMAGERFFKQYELDASSCERMIKESGLLNN